MNQRACSIFILIVLAVLLLIESAGSDPASDVANAINTAPPNDAMIRAATDGAINAMEIALHRGASVNAKTDFGWSALMLAALNHQESAARWLIQHHADVNDASPSGVTALLMAAHGGELAIVHDLIDAHAELGAMDCRHQNALNFAAQCSAGAPMIRELIALGLSPNTADDEGQTPLMVAALAGNIADVTVLIQAGANVHVKNLANQTALDQAREAHDDAMVDFLSRQMRHR